MSKKSKIINVSTTIDFGILQGTCMISFGFSYQELKKQLKDEKCNEWISAAKKADDLFKNAKYFACRTVHKGVDYYFLIFKEPFDFTDKHYTILAHEALHITQFLCRQFHIDQEDEFQAYLHSHIMEQCLDAIRGNKK